MTDAISSSDPYSSPAVGSAADDLATLRQRAMVGAAVRAAFGVASLAFPGKASRLFGFPKTENTPTARLMGRLFGVRELAMAALVLSALDDRERLGHACAISAAVDAGDVAVAVGTLRRSDGVRLPAVLTMLAGSAGAISWLDILRRLDD